MRILAISDDVAKRYYDHYKPGCLDDIDLILSCGDLNRNYLEFLVTMARCPLVYVHGNHDDALYQKPPEGCICADDAIVKVQGVRILGLGGSYRYRPDGRYMYNEKQMRKRVRKLHRKLFFGRGFDILLTHAPAYGVNDFDSLSHRGFDTFNKLMERHKPKLFVHGHIHRNYGFDIPVKTQHGDTLIVNAYESCIIDVPFGECLPKPLEPALRSAE
jgi:Predicted phosphoesterases, related to the Icc protein